MTDAPSITALWAGVIGAGLYHGLNPGMGWPLAVSAALMDKNSGALRKALLALASGHFLAMSMVLLPFSLVATLVEWNSQIRMIAGLIVVSMGLYLLINRKHPRFLARVKPTRLALWSFLAAMAHGAGLMLVPFFLALSDIEATLSGSITAAVVVAGAHTLAMALACTFISVLVYRWLGLRFLSRSWFNLDIVWALSLIVVGFVGIYSAWQPGVMGL